MKQLIILLSLLVLSNESQAQRLSTIELKDTHLSDALELIFKAGDHSSYVIDESAKNVQIGSIVLSNISWDAAIRQIANHYGYRVRRNEKKYYVVEPR